MGAGAHFALNSGVKLKDVMKRFPMSVAPDEDLVLASHMMMWAGSRHLPVVSGEELVGVLSERDVFAFRASHPDLDWREAAVEVAMRPNPETAGPEDSITEAAGRMSLHKIGCLPVTEKGALVGLVTTTDILGAEVQQAMEPTITRGPRVAEAMTPSPSTVHPGDGLLDAAGRMRSLGVRHLPVVDGGGRVVGMLSDRDVRAVIGDPTRALESEENRIRVESMHVEDAMTPEVATVDPEDSCGGVARNFASLRASAVPVVDTDGTLVGILSYVDLLRALSERLGEEAA